MAHTPSRNWARNIPDDGSASGHFDFSGLMNRDGSGEDR